MPTDLPAWVYDMIMHLDQWHDEHGTLYVEAYQIASGRHEFVKADRCGCRALEAVPADVISQARALRSYLAAKAATDHD